MPDFTYQTLLGFDYGTHKIGVAVGQALTGTATPLTTLGRVKSAPDWLSIKRLIDEWQPDALVVGVPHAQNPQQQNIAKLTRRFSRELKARYHLPVVLVDETLTSREAWSRIGGIAQRNPTRIDAMAAKLILETWLNQ